MYFSAKAEKTKDDATGRVSASIAMPGAKLGAALPYLFEKQRDEIGSAQNVIANIERVVIVIQARSVL